MLSFNIQSLPAKFSEFRELINMLFLQNCAPDVICLQEIWRIPDPDFFTISGYHPLVYKSRHINTQGGGVGLFVKDIFSFSINDVLSVFVDRILESLFIDITFNSKKFTIGTMYRPGTAHPHFSVKEQGSQFLELFSSIAEKISNSKISSYIFGDLNIDCLKYGQSTFASEYIDLLFSFGLMQIVTKPTRCSLTSATLIDHIITNVSNGSFETNIVITHISDHFPLFSLLGCHKKPHQQKNLTSRNFSEDNIERFKNSLSAMNWQNVFSTNDPQLAFSNFSDTFLTLYDLNIPVTTKKFNKNIHKVEPWITSGILTSRRKKIALSKSHFSSPSPLSLSQLKLFRNLYNKVIRAAKKMYFENELLANQSNLKKSWALIRLALNKKHSKDSSISKILVNNKEISDPQEIANNFNIFFSSVAATIVEDINPSDKPPDKLSNDTVPLFKFSDSPVTGTEIIEATKLLQSKKTLDLNGISVWLLQTVISAISDPLQHIFLNSFAQGIVPGELKIAKVVPIFKSGKKESMDNYRPISLLSSFSKIIEKIVSIRLTSFLDSNKLISNSQYGFRKKHSTVHPLLHFVNHVSAALDKKEHTLAIFCDLRKAFDTVDFSILFSKLSKLGIRGQELNWFKSYLHNRKQMVFIDGKLSSILDILIGVPQGSILGPLLFLIYINDLPICSELIALLFADDTTLYLSDSNIERLIVRVNCEFKKVCDYFRFLKLSLHPDKTKFILFSNSNQARAMDININLDFNNNGTAPDAKLISQLVRVTNESDVPAIKFLGIFIDPQLNFKFHINSIVSKTSKSLFFFRAAKHVLSQKALRAVYFAIIHAHFIYGIQIWSCAGQGNLEPLYLKQKNAIRILNNAKYNSHTEPLFKNSNILPLFMLIDFFKLQFFHCYTTNQLPASFSNIWQRNEDRRMEDQAVLRNHQEYYIPASRLSTTDRFPFFNFPRIWCDFPDLNIKSIQSRPSFNFQLKSHFLNKLNANYVCARLLCPNCHLQI